jgi:hypothetical protein
MTRCANTFLLGVGSREVMRVETMTEVIVANNEKISVEVEVNDEGRW